MRRSSLPRLPWLDETSCHCLPYVYIYMICFLIFLTFGSIFAKVPVTQPLQLSGIFTSAPHAIIFATSKRQRKLHRLIRLGPLEKSVGIGINKMSACQPVKIILVHNIRSQNAMACCQNKAPEPDPLHRSTPPLPASSPQWRLPGDEGPWWSRNRGAAAGANWPRPTWHQVGPPKVWKETKLNRWKFKPV